MADEGMDSYRKVTTSGGARGRSMGALGSAGAELAACRGGGGPGSGGALVRFIANAAIAMASPSAPTPAITGPLHRDAPSRAGGASTPPASEISMVRNGISLGGAAWAMPAPGSFGAADA